ncbi:MAG: N-acetylmuramic acid 6-phosphate etherase [Balneola sp.]|nr:N-acetylmuramic acid 6-phosphate etherase [Balneola sp.]MBO6651141.1 N-acetylmuramic acid 6-phosphate etherase [Balneola sp.]MBO6710331.1 N-acetylmuramic acid 6-phosphate etherase [Balneola sp.]MBO6799016.1 N-acetylmuramic acid 6-phosphate etherase [Balneola sp.]MBO6870130.1 N-acetylmuramic acid 6-phosphate etherase [Balneola sp.]
MTEEQALFDKISKLATEQRNEASMKIDVASPEEIVRIINEEDQKVAKLVSLRSEVIAEAVEAISESFNIGGRLLYFGAGTSGRLGVVDASECPPTFGSDPELVQGFIAGGKDAMYVAKEGAEDFEENGASDIRDNEIFPPDVVCGLAASGRTPYVVGALNEAKKRGCKTIMVSTVPKEQIDVDADYIIDVPVGPEVVMGSTRMKSGTAQKMVLNMLTTGAMIRQGKVYENVMVDLQLTNKKLVERAKKIIMIFTDLNYEEAAGYLKKADNHVKTAIVMALGKVEKDEAEKLLNKHKGFIRKALKDI